jgi:hypothetical protein
VVVVVADGAAACERVAAVVVVTGAAVDTARRAERPPCRAHRLDRHRSVAPAAADLQTPARTTAICRGLARAPALAIVQAPATLPVIDLVLVQRLAPVQRLVPVKLIAPVRLHARVRVPARQVGTCKTSLIFPRVVSRAAAVHRRPAVRRRVLAVPATQR